MGAGNTATRQNVAPVANYTDKNGNVIAAGTVGTLTYTGGSRGWSFYTATQSWSVKARDLFRFVSVSEFANALTGTDLTTDEAVKFVGVFVTDSAHFGEVHAAGCSEIARGEYPTEAYATADEAKYEVEAAGGRWTDSGEWITDFPTVVMPCADKARGVAGLDSARAILRAAGLEVAK